MRDGFGDGCKLPMQIFHPIVAVALPAAHPEVRRIDIEGWQAKPRVEMGHAGRGPCHQVFKAQEVEALFHCIRQVLHGVQPVIFNAQETASL